MVYYDYVVLVTWWAGSNSHREIQFRLSPYRKRIIIPGLHQSTAF